ncbi:response regulator [Sphingomonas sp. ERG5]|uniref:response regulator n=1 Tax=Sphingomonas sp. ERG5 TaxID=1381597 RepID=UPI00068BBC47|nr:response regulator [Sphingomonas sp. ERG5]
MIPIRVLIVDDSVTIRAMLEHIISRDPACQVVGIAADIDDARTLMRTSRPHVITLDLAMPGLGGLSFLEELKGHPHPPIIVLSSSAKDGAPEVEEAMTSGAAACFDKGKLLSACPLFVRTLKKTARLTNVTASAKFKHQPMPVIPQATRPSKAPHSRPETSG